jgi:uncharacterized protein
MFDRLALAAIGGYQRHLSPRKGFACAYRVAHGGTGCSGYAKQAIGTHGLIRATPLIRTRFSDCRDAAKELQEAKAQRKKDKWYDNACVHGCDCSGCDLPLRGCAKADATPNCDCTPDCCSF